MLIPIASTMGNWIFMFFVLYKNAIHIIFFQSALANRATKRNQMFNFDNTEILDMNSQHKNRLFLEMLDVNMYIHTTKRKY